MIWLYIILSVLVGVALGVSVSFFIVRPANQKRLNEVDSEIAEAEKRLQSIKEHGANLKRKTHQENKRIIREANIKAKDLLSINENNINAQKESLNRFEQSIRKEAQILESGKKELEQREKELILTQELLEKKLADTEQKQTELINKQEEVEKELLRVSNLSLDSARDIVFSRIENEQENVIAELIRNSQARFKREEKEILADTILKCTQKYTNLIVGDRTITVVAFEDDEFKAKIIGKAGRNIAVFQNTTGVDLIIDDSAGQLVLSCFDPVRRDVARIAIEYLLKDGRVNANKIEEAVKYAKTEVAKVVVQRGTDALDMLGIKKVDERLQKLMGRLYYRYSYSQNMLAHSVECAEIAEYIAQELRLSNRDIYLAKKAALFHDIGKSVDREISGTHVEIGVRIAQKYNFEKEVVHAIASHHEDEKPASYIDFIVIMADKISSSRPGARRDTLENYIKRVTELESIATSFDSVKTAYALSAGRELRVFVVPEDADDTDCIILASTLASKIETNLNYSGEIRVIVIRESRAVEYAR